MSALSRLKNRQSPGPDQLPAEIWKYAPREVRKALLRTSTKRFETQNRLDPGRWQISS